MSGACLKAEDEEEEEPDSEAAERRRLREAEEWRLKQLHAGTTAEVNANFQVCRKTLKRLWYHSHYAHLHSRRLSFAWLIPLAKGRGL